MCKGARQTVNINNVDGGGAKLMDRGKIIDFFFLNVGLQFWLIAINM